MKKLMDALLLGLGTFALFGLPITALVLSAWLGDSMLRVLGMSGDSGHHLVFQIKAILLMFVSSAGGLAGVMVLGSGLFMAVRSLSRQSAALEPMPAPVVHRRPARDDMRGTLAHKTGQRARA